MVKARASGKVSGCTDTLMSASLPAGSCQRLHQPRRALAERIDGRQAHPRLDLGEVAERRRFVERRRC